MTTLPSFIELMETLGLDNYAVIQENSSRSSSQSRSPSPRVLSKSSMSHQRSHSIPSSRELDINGRSGINRQRIARYSPYSSGGTPYGRRRSLSSITGDETEFEKASQPSLSTSPPSFSQSVGRRRVLPWLEDISVYSDDLAPSFEHKADTPISSYVRRKTPQSSPISPTFPRYANHATKHKSSLSSSPPTVPISLPTLPNICSETFSLPSSDGGSERGSSTRSSPFYSSNPLPEVMEESIPRRHTGLRLSAPQSADFSEHHRNHHVPPV